MPWWKPPRFLENVVVHANTAFRLTAQPRGPRLRITVSVFLPRPSSDALDLEHHMIGEDVGDGAG